MQYIYKEQKLEVSLDIFKGLSANKENFSRADLKVFLVCGDDRLRIPLNVSVNSTGTLKGSISNLPVGVYGIKAIWFKNGGRSPMMAEQYNLFGVTEYADEATNANADTAKIKVVLHVNSYGYDGLDAYELSVLRGKTTLSESDWLDWMNSGSVPQPEPSQQPTTEYGAWGIDFVIDGVEGTDAPANGGTYEYTVQAKRRKTVTYYDGTPQLNTYETADAEVLPSGNSDYSLSSANSRKYITFPKNATKVQKSISIVIEGKGDAQSLVTSKTYKQNAAAMPYITSVEFGNNKNLSFTEYPPEISCNDDDFTIKFGFAGDVTINSVTKEGTWFSVGNFDSTTKSISVAPNDNSGSAVKNGTIIIKYNTDEELRITLMQSYVTSEVISWNNVALAYDDVPAGGTTANGISPKTKTFKQIKTITRSNGYTDTEELQNTQDAVVTFSDTANKVNSSTGAVTYTTANGGAKYMLTEVTMKVVWNGKETTKTAAVYQEASKIYAIGGVSDTIPTSIGSMTAEANGTLNVSGSGKIFYVAIPSSKQITSWLDLNDDNYEMKSTIDTGSTFTYNGVSYTIYYSQNRIAQSNNYKITYA